MPPTAAMPSTGSLLPPSAAASDENLGGQELEPAARRLRLHSVVKNIKSFSHFPTSRKRASWSLASIANVATALTFVFAVLGLLAWRCRSAKIHSASSEKAERSEGV